MFRNCHFNLREKESWCIVMICVGEKKQRWRRETIALAKGCIVCQLKCLRNSKSELNQQKQLILKQVNWTYLQNLLEAGVKSVSREVPTCSKSIKLVKKNKKEWRKLRKNHARKVRTLAHLP